LLDVQVMINSKGFFTHFQNEEGKQFSSLQELIIDYKKYLEYEYQNTTIDRLGEN